MKIKITTKAQEKIAQLRLDNSILRQQLQSYGRVIDMQAEQIKRLQQTVRWYENINDIVTPTIDYPNTKEN